ncbi:MAG: hypothetical protein Kow0080_12700 [Candidatus Promineifilaceae bacterium]
MSGITLPIILSIIGLFTAVFTYRNIRRGGARFYTLEREAILRQANRTLFITVLLFTAAIGLLVNDRMRLTAEDLPTETTSTNGAATATPEPVVDNFPPLPTPTATPDLSIPTPTPTATICRGVVEGTFGNGLTLRDAPGGADVAILQDGSILTVFDDPPQQANGFTWVRVRSVFGDEGWVADNFVTFGTGCQFNNQSP